MNVLAACTLLFSTLAAQEEPKRETQGGIRKARVRAGETVTVKLRVADKDRNILSVVTLPDPVAHVLSAWDRKDLSIEHEANRLFLKLLGPREGYLDVLTRSGIHFRLLLIPLPAPAPYDSNVVVEQIGTGEGNIPEKKLNKRSAAGALELIKAMRLGEVPPDVTVRKGNREDLGTDGHARARLLYTYESARFRGYVLSLENLSSDKTYPVDVSRFEGPSKGTPLVVVGSKDVIVPPGKATRIFLVDSK